MYDSYDSDDYYDHRDYNDDDYYSDNSDNSDDYDDIPKLIKAAKLNDIKLVKEYLEKGMNPNIEKYDSTPLYYACEKENYDMVKLLIEHGANVNMLIGSITVLATACKIKNKDTRIKIINLLLENGADCNIKQNKTNILHYSYNLEPDIFKLFLSNGVDPYCQDNSYIYGNTVMFKIIDGGYLDNLKLLLDYGVNINHTNGQEQTPLIYACENDYDRSDVIKVLLNSNPDLNAFAKFRKGALNLVCAKNKYKIAILLVKKYIQTYTTEECIRIFNDALYDVISCAYNDRIKIIDLLLNNGANINNQDNNGQTILHYVCKYYHYSPTAANINLLLDKNANINLQDNNGNTALHYSFKHFDNVLELIEKGADVDIKNNKGQTIIDLLNKTPKNKYYLSKLMLNKSFRIQKRLKMIVLIELCNRNENYYNPIICDKYLIREILSFV